MKFLLYLSITLTITVYAEAQIIYNPGDEIPDELKDAFAEMAEKASEGMLGYTIKKEVFFTFDPLTQVKDEPLKVDKQTIDNLVEFRTSEKFSHLPGNVPGEKERLTTKLNQMLDEVLGGIEQNPSKYWFFQKAQPAIIEAAHEDSESRDHFYYEIEQIMDILSIESSDGLLNYYAYFYIG